MSDEFDDEFDEDEPHAYARNSDPETSWAAAHSISPEDLIDSQNAIYRCLKRIGPCTDTVLVDYYTRAVARFPSAGPPQKDSGIRSRRSHLHKGLGLVVWAGWFEKLDSGRDSRVWRVAENGELCQCKECIANRHKASDD